MKREKWIKGKNDKSEKMTREKRNEKKSEEREMKK